MSHQPATIEQLRTQDWTRDELVKPTDITFYRYKKTTIWWFF
ncbi:hypothetical protein [Pseudoalteromonas marina]|nr:hypothetical protein [Pseudoalteromonas marina]